MTIHQSRVMIVAATLAGLMALTSAGWADRAWDDVQRETERRTGATPRQKGTPDTDALVTQLLADGVTEEEAVQVALLNNAELQVAFDELGIARADVIEAGLYSDPELDLVLRFPEGERGNDLEVELGFSVADLWLVPLRKRVAKTDAERATMQVVSAVLNAVADTKQAHNACIVAEALRDQAQEVLKASQAWRDQIYRREEFGFTSELDKSMTDAFVAEREIAVAEAEAGVAIAYAHLHRGLGIEPPTEGGVAALGGLPEAPPDAPELQPLLDAAMAERPDLQAARLGMQASRGALTLQRRSIWHHVTLGPAYAQEPDGADLWGGILQVGLPVFDRNQGGRARAAARLSQAANDAEAIESLVREEVTVGAERLGLAVAREAAIREKVVPARERALDYTVTYYEQMQLNMLYQLEAREELYSAQKEHVEALGAVRAAEIELEFAVGGKTQR